METEELIKALGHDPEWICSGISDEAIYAGIDAWNQAEEELREENYVAGESRDWDQGMIVAAIFKAVGRKLIGDADFPGKELL